MVINKRRWNNIEGKRLLEETSRWRVFWWTGTIRELELIGDNSEWRRESVGEHGLLRLFKNTQAGWQE